jgi:hypothetical protein
MLKSNFLEKTTLSDYLMVFIPAFSYFVEKPKLSTISSLSFSQYSTFDNKLQTKEKMGRSKPKQNTNDSLHSEFLKLRNSLNFQKKIRKLRIDSLLKKCKSKVFRAVHESVNLLLGMNSKMNRIPQEFITNINIDYNKEFLNKTILEIYKEFHLTNGIEEDQKQTYKLTEEKLNLLKKIFTMKYSEVYDDYLGSIRYKRDLHSIKKKEGCNYCRLFEYVSKNFLQYFNTGKGSLHKRRKNTTSENENINS